MQSRYGDHLYSHNSQPCDRPTLAYRHGRYHQYNHHHHNSSNSSSTNSTNSTNNTNNNNNNRNNNNKTYRHPSHHQNHHQQQQQQQQHHQRSQCLEKYYESPDIKQQRQYQYRDQHKSHHYQHHHTQWQNHHHHQDHNHHQVERQYQQDDYDNDDQPSRHTQRSCKHRLDRNQHLRYSRYNYVVFWDLETQDKIDDKRGRYRDDKVKLLSVSCACTLQMDAELIMQGRTGEAIASADEKTFWVDDTDGLEPMLEIFDNAELIVSYNGLLFDHLVLRQYYRGDRKRELSHTFKAHDIFRRIVNAQAGPWPSLDTLLRVNGYESKMANGLEAIAMWNSGRRTELAAYCRKDVKLLSQLALQTEGIVLGSNEPLIAPPSLVSVASALAAQRFVFGDGGSGGGGDGVNMKPTEEQEEQEEEEEEHGKEEEKEEEEEEQELSKKDLDDHDNHHHTTYSDSDDDDDHDHDDDAKKRTLHQLQERENTGEITEEDEGEIVKNIRNISEDDTDYDEKEEEDSGSKRRRKKV